MAAGKIDTPHADEYTLLQLARGELDEVAAARVRRHAIGCVSCAELRREMEELHRSLLDSKDLLQQEFAHELALGPRDPFRTRPKEPCLEPDQPRDPLLLARCVEASRQAEPLARSLLEATAAGDASPLSGIDLSLLHERYSLAQALDAAILQMVEGPDRWLALGTAAVRVIRPARRRRLGGPAERAYPLLDLEGLASLVAGISCNWTGDFVRGRHALARAYRCFGKGSGSEIRLAQVELAEAQRRAFTGQPAECLVLADRAETTFLAYEMEDQAARAAGARAIACGYLGRNVDAVGEFRSALSTFERLGLWNAYVSMLNGLGFTLLRMGELDEARREFARALRRISPIEQPAVRAFVRANLARVLEEAGRFEEAARAFAAAARLFSGQGAQLDALTSTLAEAECHARAGASSAAAAAFARFQAAVAHLDALDPALLSSLEAALGGEAPNLDLLDTLRRQAEDALRAHLAALRSK